MAEQEHRVIFLEPRCVGESGEDRHWCQDDAWGACDECGTPSVKYIIASEHADLVRTLEQIREVADKASAVPAERLQDIRVILNRVKGQSTP
jgi:hypothetical protein